MSLVVKTVSDSQSARKDLDQLNKSVQNIETSVQNVTERFSKLATTISTVVATGVAISGFLKLSDSFVNLENKIKSVTEETVAFKKALAGVQDIAIKTRSDLNATAALYQKISLNSKEIGINVTDTLTVVSTFNKALKLSGANASEAAGAILQFGQAIGSGHLQGDELRSIAENAPYIYKKIAEGFKLSIGEMKKAGEEGKLVSGKVLKIMLETADEIDKKFADLGITYGDAFKNMGTAFQILGNKVKSYFFGTGSGMAKWLNDMSLGVYEFAKNFSLHMTMARHHLTMFVLDGILMFKHMWTAAKEAFGKISESVKNLYEEFKPQLREIGALLMGWASIGASAIKTFYNQMTEVIRSNPLVAAILRAMDELKAKVSGFFTNIFSTLGLKMPEIDVSKFFKNLTPMLDLIKNWAKTIEGWFYWLYDRVIGHSWIPDLVNGVTHWLGKLLGAPLAFVKTFVSTSSKLFASLSGFGVFALGIKLAMRYKLALAGVLTVLAGIVAMGAGLFGGDKTFTIKNSMSKEKAKDYLKEAIPKLKESITAFGKSVKENYKSNPVTHFVKQLFGMKDTTAGKLWGRKIDTNAYVGVGPKRNKADRPFLHDAFNAVIPPQFQAGLALAVTAAFALGTRAFFLNSTFGAGLGLLVAGIIGTSFMKIIDPTIIKEALFGTVRVVLTALSDGITKILGGNAIKDPLGLVALLAAFATLFAAGRASLGRAAASVLTAPTRWSRGTADVREQRRVQTNYDETRDRLRTFHQDRQAREDAARQNYARAHADLANTRTATGNLLGGLDASRAIRSGVDYGQSPQTRAVLEAAMRARREDVQARWDNRLDNRTRAYRELEASRDQLGQRNNHLNTRIDERRIAREDGIRNGLSGLGGVVGGVAGFQVGSEIAKAMTGSPEWVRVATVMGSAFVGQWMASGVGGWLATMFIAAWTPIATYFTATVIPAIAGLAASIGAFLLANPVALVIVAITAGLLTAYLLWKALPDEWLKNIKGWFGIGDTKPENGAADTMAMKAVNPMLVAHYEIFKEKLLSTIPNTPDAAWSTRIGNLFEKTVNTVFDWVGRLVAPTPSRMGEGIFSSVKRASGGWIRGPGTDKSDSIPAMLSNGEYVVNAEASRKNAGLLEAINSGKLVGFSLGGLAGKGTLDPNFTKSVDNAVNKLTEVNLIIKTPPGGQKPTDVTMTTIQGQALNILGQDKLISTVKETAEKSDNKLAEVFNKLLDKIPGGETFKAMLPNATPKTTSEAIKDMLNSGKEEREAAARRAAWNDPKPVVAGVTGAVAKMKTWAESLGGKKSGEVTTDVVGYLNAKDGGGFTGMTAEEFAKANDKVQSSVINLIGAIKESEDKGKLAGKGTYGASLAAADVKRLKAELDNTVINGWFGAGEKNSKFAEDNASKKAEKLKRDKEDLKFSDQYRIINETLPELAMSFDEFRKMTDTARTELFKDVFDIAGPVKAMMDYNIGHGEDGKTVPFSEPMQKLEDQRKNLSKDVVTKFEGSRSAFQNLSPLFNEVRLQLTEEIIAGLDKDGLVDIKAIAEAVKRNQERAKRPNATPDNLLEIRKDNEKLTEKYDELVKKSLRKGMSGFKAFAVDFADIGVGIEQGTYNRLLKSDRAIMDGIRAGIAKAEAIAKAEDGTQAGVDAQAVADKAREKLQEMLAKRATEKAKLAGESFSSEIYDGFNSALAGLMHGKAAEGKSVIQTFFRGILDSTTSTIINTFSKGVTERLTNMGGDVLKNFGSQMFSSISGTESTSTLSKDMLGVYESMPMWVKVAGDTYRNEMDKASDAASGTVAQDGPNSAQKLTAQGDAIATAETGLSQVWRELGSSLDKGLGGLVTKIKAFNPMGLISVVSKFASLFSGPPITAPFLDFATGGYVSGPGTGTSDSIPAMLSNGEFVMNARATKQFEPLLQSLNSGSFKKFAAGGLVSTAMVTAPTMAEVKSNNSTSSGNTQTINLSITGDISRQTKKEIYGMLPTIAAGVNSHNREKGYK